MAKKRRIESIACSSQNGRSMERTQQEENPLEFIHVSVAEISNEEEIVEDIQVQVVQKRQEDMIMAAPVVGDDLTSAIGAYEIVVLSQQQKNSKSVKAAGEYLHNFHNDQPPMDEVEKVIELFPEALLFQDENGHIPIQTAVQHVESVKYVPLLAERAIQRKIGGPERGGLLLPYTREDPECNILQYLVTSVHDEASTWYDESCIHALKDLFRARLLNIKDCILFNLVGYASATECLQRLEYLTETFSSALATPVPLTVPLPMPLGKNYPIHFGNYCDSVDIDVFATLLKAGMRHYPESFGFMFKQNALGERAINQAIEKFGKDDVFQCIRSIISPTEEYPILHHVIRYTPDLFDDFFYRYPDGLYLKDRRGRLLLHVALKSGLKLSPSLMMMIHSNKECIEVRDPVTNLYPFMLAATSGRKKDLTTIYKLISLRPEMISKCLGIDEA